MLSIWSCLTARGKSPAYTWSILFVLVILACHVAGGTNPASRFALLNALVEDRHPAIDAYVEHTIDWAQPPGGHYYSNKAPGPVLAVLPLYYVYDWWRVGDLSPRQDRDSLRYAERGIRLRVLSLLLQVLPFGLLVWGATRSLEQFGVSRGGQHLASAAILLGSTASFFMGIFFGHGFAAVCVLAASLALLRGALAWSAFAVGWAVLSEYSLALLLPGYFLAQVWVQPKLSFRHRLGKIVLGAALPAVLWIGYHTWCYGSPWRTAGLYENPLFLEQHRDALWGMFVLPRWSVLGELLYGFCRGLLWTQPWVLAAAVLAGWLLLKPGRQELKAVVVFALTGLLMLLAMNASFNNWEAGATPGPRYLSAVLPALGLVLAGSYDALPRWAKLGLWVLVLIGVIFQLLALAVAILPMCIPIWPAMWQALVGNDSGTPAVRLAAALPILCWCLANAHAAHAAKTAHTPV